MVIDCDQHLFETPDLWARYIDPAHRDTALRLEDDETERRVGFEQVVGGPETGEAGADDRDIHLPVAGQRGARGQRVAAFQRIVPVGDRSSGPHTTSRIACFETVLPS